MAAQLRIYWRRMPLIATILPLGYLFTTLFLGRSWSLWDFPFLWLCGIALLNLHLLLELKRAKGAK